MLCVGKPAGDLSTVYSPDRIYPAASRDNRMRSCRKMVKKSRMDLLAWKETVRGEQQQEPLENRMRYNLFPPALERKLP